jgi:hypothetical protein
MTKIQAHQRPRRSQMRRPRLSRRRRRVKTPARAKQHPRRNRRTQAARRARFICRAIRSSSAGVDDGVAAVRDPSRKARHPTLRQQMKQHQP